MRYSVLLDHALPPPTPSNEPKPSPTPSSLSTLNPDETPNKQKTDIIIADQIQNKVVLTGKVDYNEDQHDDSDSEGELQIDMGSQECIFRFVFRMSG